MTGRQRIEALTSSWYGFYALTALCSLFVNGFGVFSIMARIFGLTFSILFTFLVGRRLLKKGHLTRALLLAVSAIGTLSGGVMAGKMLLGHWSFSMMMETAGTLAWMYMHVRSFRVLTSESVRQYFN